ncbi:MAG: hypothetical protein WDW38_001538 [Sanguina aurantia]
MAKPKGRRQQITRSSIHKAKEHEVETIRLINAALDQQPVDLSALRKLASVRGLVNNQLRSKCWPLLLPASPSVRSSASPPASAPASCTDPSSPIHSSSADPSTGSSSSNLDGTASPGSGSDCTPTTHRDSHVVDCDVVRSLWSYTEGWAEEERALKREELKRMLNGVVLAHADSPSPVYYYQGLHDVASVLLMVVGERDASPLLAVLASVHLRDCTRPSIDAVLELLGMLFPILAAVDPQLAQHLQDADLMPYFALSWFITWFSHGQRLLQDAARLFDLFLSSHPLMPLYVGAAAMHNARAQLLRLREMPELHTFLVNLDLGQGPALDQLARQAISLIKLSPPLPLAQRHLHHLSLASAVAPAAALSDVAGAWGVPEHPPWEKLRRKERGGGGGVGGGPLGLVWRVLLLRSRGREGGKGGLLASTALSLTGIVGVYLVAAVVMTYGSGRSGQQGLFEAGGRSLWPGLGLFLQL